MTAATALTSTPKSALKKLIIAAMNDIRAKGNEPSWQTVSRFVEKSGLLKPGDMTQNPSADAGTGFQYVWQTSLSFAASEMKAEGELVRESGYPWILTEWGITGVDLVKEILKRQKPQLTTCSSCWTQHRAEVECW